MRQSFRMSSHPLPSVPPNLKHEKLVDALQKRPLLKGKTWKLSPFPWPLSKEQVEVLKKIGQACLEFYKVADRLYVASYYGKSLLRNRELLLPWVADYFNQGKPESLIRHGLNKNLKADVPIVIRPDLLLTENGWALTELDCVPGGIGLTAQLYSLYEKAFPMAGSSEQIMGNFYTALKNLTPEVENPMIAIVIHEQSGTYRPEFDWLAERVRVSGKRVVCIDPSEIEVAEGCLILREGGERIDSIYRFFDLFDLPNMPNGESILRAVEEHRVKLTPPCKMFQEEKLEFALFHHYQLRHFWEENLSAEALSILREIMPQTWILDPTPIPANGSLWGPTINGQPMSSWSELGHLTQEQRNFILKISGFHETAWGARGVILGTDVSRGEWEAAITGALNMWERNPYIVQDYKKPKGLSHFAYMDNGEVEGIQGRLRLSPYYMIIGNEANFVGALATICPLDKKIIHGMVDALLLPCSCE